MDSRSSIMASSIPDSDFTLPTVLLAQEDPVMGCENSIFNFPIDFPYEFDSFCPVDSSSDEDDFNVGLTRCLTRQPALDPKKSEIKSGSPKSTLSGVGSWSMSSNGSTNGEVSPPTTPLGTRNDVWEPVYAGADSDSRSKNQNTSFYSDQRFAYGVSRLKNQDQVNQSYSVWGRQQQNAASNHLQQNQIQSRGMITTGYENGRYVRPLGLPQSAWPPLQVQQNKNRSASSSSSVFVSGSGAKRGCAGTGVFLPRRFDDSTHNNKKSDYSTALLPAKVEDMHRVGDNYQRLNSAFAYKHDAPMATRNGVLAQQKGDLQAESAVKYELCLPQEWIY